MFGFLNAINPVHKLLFPAPNPPTYTRAEVKENLIFIDNVQNKHHSGTKVACLYFPAENSKTTGGGEREEAKAVIYLHGNGEDLGELVLYLEHVGESLLVAGSNKQERMVTVIAPEYPGYGVANDQAPSEEGINAVALSCYAYLTEFENYQPHNILIFGRSIGTGPATQLCVSVRKVYGAQVGALILQSPYTSINDLFKHHAGALAGFLTQQRWHQKALLASSDVFANLPILFMHGQVDTVIPSSNSKELYQACASTKKRLELFESIGHNDMHYHALLPCLQSFLKEYRIDNGDESKRRDEEEEDDDVDAEILDSDPSVVTNPSTHSNASENNKNSSNTSFESAVRTALSNPSHPGGKTVIVIGAGPCGLAAACSIALQCPPTMALRILIFERNIEYVRSHVLRIDQDSLSNCHPIIAARIKRLGKVVRTMALEKEFNDMIANEKDLGGKIIIHRGVHISDMHAFVDVAKECQVDFIVCADGARSHMREDLMHGLDHKRTLLYFCDVKYEAVPAENNNSASKDGKKKQGPLLDKIKYIYPTLKVMSHPCQEIVGSIKVDEKTGVETYPVTLRFFISSEAEYNSIRQVGGTFRDPLSLPKNMAQLPPSLQEDIRIYMAVRSMALGESRKSAIVSAVELNVYQSKYFAVRVNGIPTALVGDAAFGVPYFRALNNGLICSAELGLRVSDYLHSGQTASSSEAIDINSSHKQQQQQQQQQPSQSSSQSQSESQSQPQDQTNSNNQTNVFTNFVATTKQVLNTSVNMTKHSLNLSKHSVMASSHPSPFRGQPSHGDPLGEYNRFVTKLAVHEEMMAQTKNEALLTGHDYLKISNAVPLQINFWTTAKLAELQATQPFT